MPLDMFDRLHLDPGSRTYGELIQERQWSLQEIVRLRLLTSSRETYAAKHSQQISRKQQDEKTLAEPASQLLRLKQVTERFSLSRSTIYNMIQEGRFPPPIRAGERAVRWRYSDLLDWQESLKR